MAPPKRSKSRESTVRRSTINKTQRTLESLNIDSTRPSIERFSLNRTSLARRNPYDAFKDPRQLNDKGFREKAIQDLMMHLKDTGFGEGYTIAQYRSPSKKIFLDIFTFLYGQLNPGFKLGPKPDEEIILIIKALGYRANITKSTLCSVSSQFSWPQLLGFFDWLRRLIVNETELDMTCINDQLISDDQNTLIRDYYQTTYSLYLQGKDDFTEEYRQFEKELMADCDFKDEMTTLQSTLMEIEQLENELLDDQTKDLSIELKQLNIDVNCLQAEISEIKSDICIADSRLKAVLDNENQLDREKSHAQAESVQLKQILQSKNLSIDKWQQMETEIKLARKNLEGIVEEVENLKQEFQEVALVEYGQKMNNFKEKIISYNKTVCSMHLDDPSLPDALPGLKSNIETSLCISNLYSKLLQQSSLQLHDFFEKLGSKITHSTTILKNSFPEIRQKISECEEKISKLNLDHLKITTQKETKERKLIDITDKYENLTNVYSSTLKERQEIEEQSEILACDKKEILKILNRQYNEVNEYNRIIKERLNEVKLLSQEFDKNCVLKIESMNIDKKAFMNMAEKKLALCQELSRKRGMHFISKANKLSDVYDKKIEENELIFKELSDFLEIYNNIRDTIENESQ